jgi:hypothetical protein
VIPGGLLRILFAAFGMFGVIGSMYIAAGAALERPHLLRIDAAVASALTADYSSDPHPERPLPPLDPEIIIAAAEDLDPTAPRIVRPTPTPTAIPTVPPAAPTSAPLPSATPRPEPTPTETEEPRPTPSKTTAPDPSVTGTAEPDPTPTAEPKPTKTPDPCKKPKPWENFHITEDAAEPSDSACPSPTPYATPYEIPDDLPIPR